MNRRSRRKYTSVSIPVSLHRRIERIITNSGFKSVSDYVTYILREVVAMHEIEKLSIRLTEKEIEEIKQRLKALGYL